MAALTITGISLGEDAVIEKVQFAEAVGLGNSVYKDANTAGKWRMANNGTAAEAGADGIGISLHATENADEWGVIVTSGTVKLSGGLTKGTTYAVGDADGDISPDADVGTTEFKTILGIAGTESAGTNTRDDLLMTPVVSGQAFA